MIKLITKKQPDIIPKREDFLESRDQVLIHDIYKMKRYTIIYDYEECIYVNPEIKDYEKIVEILQKIFACRFINKVPERLFDELKDLTDKETGDKVLIMWLDWKKAVRKLELNEKAEEAIKQARKHRLYYKARKEKEVIEEVFNIGLGVYKPGRERSFHQGAENAFMYGYLMGINANSRRISKRGAANGRI